MQDNYPGQTVAFWNVIPVLFNYPEQSSVKSLADIDKYGIKTYFCSNVCAAYDKGIYQKTGGFYRAGDFQ